LLILDLDETLVHSTEDQLERDADFHLEQYFVYKRPGVEKFLVQCSRLFDIAVWTSSSSDYASEVVRMVFPSDIKLNFLFAQERCVFRFNHDILTSQTIKPLTKVKRKGYSIKKIIIIDDLIETFQKNYGNAILVQPYRGEVEDTELSMLIQYLEILSELEDVRNIDKRHWRSQIQARTS
jgi:carboxy-terminal domain RNA polymerase II polypeptide A small phosphatase